MRLISTGRRLKSRGLLTAALMLAWGLFAVNLSADTEMISLDGTWLIRSDPDNAGKEAQWFAQPLTETGETANISVPGVLQEVYKDYHGLVWYERSFTTPENPNNGGRTLLRFWQAEYRADVWVNGRYAGAHEGGESAFELDATPYLAPAGESNRLTVRVLNANEQTIDGINFNNIPRRNNTNTVTLGCGYASGGLVDSVELLLVPAVRISGLHLIPNWQTGEIIVKAAVENFGTDAASARLTVKAASADGGPYTPKTVSDPLPIAPGQSTIESSVTVPDFKLWNLNDPNLYTVEAELIPADGITDSRTAVCGFRDFRFENGAFRLNGKRIYVKCSHSGSDSPITHRIPIDPELYRRDILLSKLMGLNMIRYIAGMPRRFQLDLCDRIGFLVYEECLAGWCYGPCPERSARYDAQTAGMVERDWNHPSVVIWGLLNETTDVAILLQAADFLPKLRRLDPDRMVFFNSGSFDTFAGTESKMADYAIWRRKHAPIMPAAIKNETDEMFQFDGTFWHAHTFFLHPGDIGNEYAVLKWTAPSDGNYKIDAKFTDVVRDGVATVDIHLFCAETEIWTGWLNLNGTEKETGFQDSRSMKAGEELAVVVGIGDNTGFGDTTAIDMKITASDGTCFDVTADYTSEQNPNGVWSYGYLPAGNTPDLTQFTLFNEGQKTLCMEPIGRFANPGADSWQNELADTHPYKQVPHTAAIIQELRTHAVGNMPVFLSEYGIGSGVNLFRLMRYYEQYKATDAADAVHYKNRFDLFMGDWNRWKLDEAFYGPDDFFRQAIARMAQQRRIGINAIRSNPHIVAHSVTGTHDQGISGEGLTTIWREMKPGTVEVMADVFAPLRFCNFVEPVQVYSGDSVRLEAVLVNEDVLEPGDYPVHYRVVGPNNAVVFDEVRTLTIPVPAEGEETPMVLPAFDLTIPVTGEAGEYHFRADFEQGAANCGGWEHFFVSQREEQPAVNGHFIVWGNDENLIASLKTLGIDAVPYTKADGTTEAVTPESKIVVGASCDRKTAEDYAQLVDYVKAGADVLFLSAAGSFETNGDMAALWPLDQKLYFASLSNWLYHKDDWTKKCAAFDGLPCGDVSDYLFYRELIPAMTFNGPELVPDEALAGALSTEDFNGQYGYAGGLSLAVWNVGSGRVIVNTWKIQENLPNHPIAERMLRNMLNWL